MSQHQHAGSEFLSSAPLYGFPPALASRYRIAFYGDPALGAALARRHHVVWTRPEEARYVIEHEAPDLLLVTARVDSLRTLRSKPLIASTGEVSPDFLSLLDTFQERGVPVVYHGLVDDLELERHLPIAERCDAVMARTERALEAYLRHGIVRASFHELGAFGYADTSLPAWARGGSGLLRGSSAKTGGTSAGRSYVAEASALGIDEIDESTDAVRGARAGLELVRRTAWLGTSSLQHLRHTTSVLVPLASWATLPSNLFEAVLHGALPLLFGSRQQRQSAAARWSTAASFDSLEAAVTYARVADERWPRARFETSLADVLERFLIDDWLAEALRTTGTGAVPRAPRTDELVLELDPAAVTPQDAARLQDVVSPDALRFAGRIEGSALEGMTFRTNLLQHGSHAAAAWSGASLTVHEPSRFGELQLRLLRGWARLHPDTAVHIHDEVGARVASLHHGDDLATRRPSSELTPEPSPGVLLVAQTTGDNAS